MAQELIKNNYKIVDFDKKSDIYIINTCTVTNISDRKSRQIISRAKSKNKQAIIVVTGCYVQRAKEELINNKNVDIIIGNSEKNNIVQILETYIKKKKVKTKDLNITNIMEQSKFQKTESILYNERTRALIKIQDGCNNYCSYCIIPYVKGKSRSRKKEEIQDEAQNVVENGIKEIVITGIHIASYGKDFKNENIGLLELIESLNKIENLKRIRLGSLEPNIITEKFLIDLKKSDKVCDHFHISLQSGCDDTLKRMNRKYSKKEVEKSIELIRKIYPDAAITTDIIVGFPGETEKEFNETYEFLKKIKFSKMHIFKYSKRQGTKAAVLENQIDR